MKDFAEFKETLTRDVLDGLAKTALETTNKLLDTKYGEGELEKHFAFFRRILHRNIWNPFIRAIPFMD